MKYIRTCDNIYHVYKETDNWYYVDRDLSIIIHKDEVIRQANTIEELCDEAVAIYPDGSHDNCSVMHIVDNNEFCEAVYGCLSVSVDDLKKDYECYKIYGAIWTEWGLKYVAKLNDNGRLELYDKN